MALADRRAQAEQVYRKGPQCSVCTLIETLPEADAKTLVDWIEDPAVMGVTIARALAMEGHRLPADRIQRHRRGHQ